MNQTMAKHHTHLRPAINAMCKECVASDIDKGYLKEIEGCLGTSCPLYAVRPVRGKNKKYVPAHTTPEMIKGVEVI
jgi:hypothetical protein